MSKYGVACSVLMKHFPPMSTTINASRRMHLGSEFHLFSPHTILGDKLSGTSSLPSKLQGCVRHRVYFHGRVRVYMSLSLGVVFLGGYKRPASQTKEMSKDIRLIRHHTLTGPSPNGVKLLLPRNYSFFNKSSIFLKIFLYI